MHAAVIRQTARFAARGAAPPGLRSAATREGGAPKRLAKRTDCGQVGDEGRRRTKAPRAANRLRAGGRRGKAAHQSASRSKPTAGRWATREGDAPKRPAQQTYCRQTI